MYEYETMRVVLGHRAAPLVIGHGYAVRTREQYQSCVILLLAGTGALLSETVVEWIYGFFSEVGQRIGGSWLHVCIQAPAAMSNVGLLRGRDEQRLWRTNHCRTRGDRVHTSVCALHGF
jgi:hypothetical protein